MWWVAQRWVAEAVEAVVAVAALLRGCTGSNLLKAGISAIHLIAWEYRQEFNCVHALPDTQVVAPDLQWTISASNAQHNTGFSPTDTTTLAPCLLLTHGLQN